MKYFFTIFVFLFFFLVSSNTAFADCGCKTVTSANGTNSCVINNGTCPVGREAVCQTNSDGACSHNLLDGGTCVCQVPERPFDGTLASSATLPGYGNTKFKFAKSTVGEVIRSLLVWIYPAAGLVLLVMLIMGGIQLMTAAGDSAKSKAGYGRITTALIGFLIVFISYFVLQLVEVLLGVTIL